MRVKGADCTAETIALYDILSRLASIALQYGAPVQTVGSLLRGVQVAPAGMPSDRHHDRHGSNDPAERSKSDLFRKSYT